MIFVPRAIQDSILNKVLPFDDTASTLSMSICDRFEECVEDHIETTTGGPSAMKRMIVR